jgi:hypothetical protein
MFNANLTIETDLGLSAATCQDAVILNENVRKYVNRSGQEVVQPTITLQGVTSDPQWNRFGTSGRSYHFKVHTTDPETQQELSLPVAVFGDELARKVASVLEHRRAFVRLRGDYRSGTFTAEKGPRQGETIVSSSVAINFLNQIEVLAVYAAQPDPWSMAVGTINKEVSGSEETLPF